MIGDFCEDFYTLAHGPDAASFDEKMNDETRERGVAKVEIIDPVTARILDTQLRRDFLRRKRRW